jgi:hypothetical protein
MSTAPCTCHARLRRTGDTPPPHATWCPAGAPTPTTATVPLGLADCTANIQDGSTSTTGINVLLWVADDLPLYIDAVYAYEANADLCSTCGGSTYMLEDVGGTRHCGHPERFCPPCWADMGPAQHCGHPEHW